MPSFDPRRIVLALLDHGVDFVVIGANAAILQGVPLPTTLDFDVTVAVSGSNRKRLVAALAEMDAKLRTIDEEVEAPLDKRMLANMSVATLMTRYGPFDVLFEPAGAPEYRELKERSREVRAYGVVVRAASVRDVIAMKMAAGREKDAAHLAILLEYQRQNPTES